MFVRSTDCRPDGAVSVRGAVPLMEFLRDRGSIPGRLDTDARRSGWLLLAEYVAI